MGWKTIAIALLLGVACNKAEPTVAATVEPNVAELVDVPATQPPATAQPNAVVRALSVRDPEPTCASVEALMSADPAAEWLRIVDEVSMPPWVPMRAASCVLSGHAASSQGAIVRWVSEPKLQGLGVLALNHLDDLPEATALAVATAALSGPRAEDARARIGQAKRDSIRALAVP